MRNAGIGFVSGPVVVPGRVGRTRKLQDRPGVMRARLQCLDGTEDYLKVTKDPFSVVMFVSPDCTACEGMSKALTTLSDQHPDKEFYTMDVMKNQKLAKSLGVRRIPSFHFYTMLGDKSGILENFATASEDKLAVRLGEYLPGRFNAEDYKFEE